jgi:hypothetical protein
MSTEELDLILGRLTRESAECRRNIAAIEAKLASFCDALDNVSVKLRWTWKPQNKPGTAIEEARALLPTIPGQNVIADTLTELSAERERCEQITDQLSRMTV